MLRFATTVLIVQIVISTVVDANEGQPSADRASKHTSSRTKKRLLLLGQKPDGHPRATHEYDAGVRILAKCLQNQRDLQMILVSADEPWKEGPGLIDGADGVVVFVSEGAKWIQQDRLRLAAFNRLAARGGGFVCLHWGMGTRKAEYINDFVQLFGGCHGGPDRKYKVVDVEVAVANDDHPIMRGVAAFDVHEEFYYTLKFAKPKGSITPLVQVPIDDAIHTVAWAWERPAGGRSFGFSGCHFHDNWKHVQYRRLVAQAILWTLNRPIPMKGLPVKISKEDIGLPDTAR